MLKRSWPRFSTVSSALNGSSATGALPVLPVKNASLSCSVPRAMVPSISGRALPPSAKNAVPRSARYLGWLCMSCRQPATPAIESAATHSATILPADAGSPALVGRRREPRTADRAPRMSVCDFIDVPRTQPLQEVRGALPIEFRVGRFDGQEESLGAADLREARHIEHRVIRHRQPAQQDPAEDGGERGKEDGQLE